MVYHRILAHSLHETPGFRYVISSISPSIPCMKKSGLMPPHAVSRALHLTMNALWSSSQTLTAPLFPVARPLIPESRTHFQRWPRRNTLDQWAALPQKHAFQARTRLSAAFPYPDPKTLATAF
jgi:hypothetical protein